MNQPHAIQALFFQQIREKLPPNLSFVHEVAELLGISYDSAYRRIRGEKELSMEELYRLAGRFSISIDSLFSVQNNNVLFRFHTMEPDKFSIKDWLGIIYEDIKRIHCSKEQEIIYAAKDPPIFHYFQFPEIAAFKVFFWEKTLFHFPKYEGVKLRVDDLDSELYELGKNILKTSTKIPTIEIWNEDTFNITLRQIEYYWISGYFEKKDDILNLIDKLDKWISHIMKQAELGMKFPYGEPPDGIENSFLFYENELVLNDNTIYVKLDNISSVYLTFNVLCLLITRDERFVRQVEVYLRGLLRNSTLISLTNAKERNRFFNRLLQTIREFKERVER